MKQKEINTINEYLKKKPNIPAVNFFSKIFLSFREDESIAGGFYEYNRKNKIYYEN